MVLAAAIAGPAQAVPVAAWSWYNIAGFTAWKDTDGVSGGPGTGVTGGITATDPFALGVTTQLAWGGDTGTGQSRLFTSGEAGTPSVTHPGLTGTAAPSDGVTKTFGVNLTHDNNVITLLPPATLKTTTLHDVLYISPAVSDPTTTPPGQLPAIDFFIQFLETSNQADPCADGTALSNPLNQPDGCRDIFVVLNPQALSQIFQFGPDFYQITIGADGLGPLSNGACDAMGVAHGCVGFETKENAISSLDPFFTIGTVQIPEPGIMLLVGAGLLILGVARRKQHQV